MCFLVLWSLTCRTFVTEVLKPTLHSRLSTTEAENLVLAPDLLILGKGITIPAATEPRNLKDINPLGVFTRKSIWSPEPALPWTWTAARSTETRLMSHFTALPSSRDNAQSPVLWASDPSFLGASLLIATRDHLKAHVMLLPSTFPLPFDQPSWSGLSLPVQPHLLLFSPTREAFPHSSNPWSLSVFWSLNMLISLPEVPSTPFFT